MCPGQDFFSEGLGLLTYFLSGLVWGLHPTPGTDPSARTYQLPFSWRQGLSLTDEIFIITIFYLWRERVCLWECACVPLHLGPRQLPKSPQMLLMNIPRQRWPRFAVIDYLYVK